MEKAYKEIVYLPLKKKKMQNIMSWFFNNVQLHVLYEKGFRNNLHVY